MRGVVRDRGERFHFDPVHRQPEVTEMASVTEIESVGMLSASVRGRVSNKIELAAFQHEIVFKHDQIPEWVAAGTARGNASRECNACVSARIDPHYDEIARCLRVG